ncbi:MAG: hypothetical protein JWL70_1391 [Acidimicrobiia bacterium]|nr:hypothetical protein [Acidimicrobiia bacterium]
MSEALTPLELVTKTFEHLTACDLEATRPCLAEDLTYHLLNFEERHQRVYHGREAFLALRAQVDKVSGGTYTYLTHGIYPAGDEMVIVHAETQVTFDGRSGGGHWVIVARVIGGVIVQMTDTPATALDHFWRPPAAGR